MTGREPQLKHEEVAAVLEEEIRTGRLGRGGRLPGEHALAAQFDVSRTTVRHALARLDREGLIATRPGKGSFVVYDGAPLDARRGWAVAFQERGIEIEVEVLRLEVVTDRGLAEALGRESAEFVAVDRIRRVVGGPAVSYERSRVPALGALLDLPERGLVDGSLTATLAAAGLIAGQGEQWVRGGRLDGEESVALGRSTDDWFLHTTLTVRTPGGSLVEHVRSSLDPEHFQLHLEVL
ncbi:GntR family transcriptional regulator [Actinotalea sp.]|uniref:GntR family transcriptional regulator n=1 Tax=Actinotalea sp. TaxID=1872145 RepID=UPI0035667F65